MNATIRDNILFGQLYDREKYKRVVNACQLKTDLEMLEAGDATEIGERGINMSGGQKQRISLARAVYADKDIYLIDDALSALDAFVGKKIFNEVFLGLLGDKTRIIVTHALQYMPMIPNINLLESGEFVAEGTFDEIKKTDKYLSYVSNYKETLKSINEEIESSKGSKRGSTVIVDDLEFSIDEDVLETKQEELLQVFEMENYFVQSARGEKEGDEDEPLIENNALYAQELKTSNLNKSNQNPMSLSFGPKTNSAFIETDALNKSKALQLKVIEEQHEPDMPDDFVNAPKIINPFKEKDVESERIVYKVEPDFVNYDEIGF